MGWGNAISLDAVFMPGPFRVLRISEDSYPQRKKPQFPKSRLADWAIFPTLEIVPKNGTFPVSQAMSLELMSLLRDSVIGNGPLGRGGKQVGTRLAETQFRERDFP
jgi:hypothetical protein